MSTYIETDCTFTHEGRTFESGGAVVSDNEIWAYVGKDGTLTNWHGAKLGTCRVLSSWRTPHSGWSDRMYSFECFVNGVRYVGRGCGVGMIVRARRSARQFTCRGKPFGTLDDARAYAARFMPTIVAIEQYRGRP